MMSVNCVHLRNHLSEVLNTARYAKEQIEVRRRGRLLGAFIPPEDWHYLRIHKVVDAPTRARRAARDLLALGVDPPADLDRIVRGFADHGTPSPPTGPEPWDGML